MKTSCSLYLSGLYYLFSAFIFFSHDCYPFVQISSQQPNTHLYILPDPGYAMHTLQYLCLLYIFFLNKMLLSQLRARTVFPGTRGPLVQPPVTGLRSCKAEGENPFQKVGCA